MIPPFSDWNSDEICIDLANSDSRLKGQDINTMGDLLGIVNHGLFIHAHVLLGKPISGKIGWCHCLENMKEVLPDPIIFEHRFLSPGVRSCHVKKIPMVICWVRLPNDKPRLDKIHLHDFPKAIATGGPQLWPHRRESALR